MVIEYMNSESTVKPSAIEIGKRSAYVRRNIVEQIREDKSGNKVSYWVYEEACLSHAEFNEYINFISAQNAVNGVNDSGNIVQLMTGQEISDNNQMVVMEAIADLYDVIAMLA